MTEHPLPNSRPNRGAWPVPLLFTRSSTLKLRANTVLARALLPSNIEHVGLAAYLAIFYILLTAACGCIDGRIIPFAATGALKPGFIRHAALLTHRDRTGMSSCSLPDTLRFCRPLEYADAVFAAGLVFRQPRL